MENIKEKMEEIFGGLTDDDTVGILVHPSPDPDCLGAADAMSVLLKEAFGLNSKTYHLGEISHPQNKSMRNILNIILHDGNKFDPKSVAATIVLDTDIEGTGLKGGDFVKASVRMDHHEMERSNGAEWCDVRPVGSTCSIVLDYLKAFDVALEDYPDTATAMVLGIKTDTLDFTAPGTSDLDIQAYSYLLPYVNKENLSKVINYSLPRKLFDIETEAFKQSVTRGTTLVSFVGEVQSTHRDVISTIADRFARIDGVSTSVIMGLIGNTVVASMRSSDSKVNVNETCVSIFGEDAGGKKGSGGARLPLGPAYDFITEKELKESVKNEAINKLTEQIFEALGEQKDEEEES